MIARIRTAVRAVSLQLLEAYELELALVIQFAVTLAGLRAGH